MNKITATEDKDAWWLVLFFSSWLRPVERLLTLVITIIPPCQRQISRTKKFHFFSSLFPKNNNLIIKIINLIEINKLNFF